MSLTDQTIFRVASVVKPYSMLGNAMLQDERLSIEARGFLASVMSRPADWRFNTRWAMKAHSVGRDKLYRIIRELEACGYCKRDQRRLPGGSWAPIEYSFTDCPELLDEKNNQNSPQTGFQEAVKNRSESKPKSKKTPLPEKPHTAEPHTGNQDALQKKDSTKDRQGQKTEKGDLKSPVAVAGDQKRKRKGRAQIDLGLADRESADERAAGIADDRQFEENAFRAFLALADRVGIARPSYLTETRRKAMRALFDTFGRDAWALALQKIEESDFCQGKTGSGWVISFEKLLDERIFTKVVEGYYRNHNANVVPLVDLSDVSREKWADRIKAWDERGRDTWPEKWGPAPGKPGCGVPADLLEQFGVGVAA